MATSASSDFNLNRDEIIEGAARKIQAIRAGASMSDKMRADFAQALNAMVKRWMSSGIHVWKVTEATLFPAINTAEYALSNAVTSAHATESFVDTQMATAAASGASTLTVDDDAGFANADNIGITLDDGTMQWTTINGVPAANVITLTDNTTDTVAVDNRIYGYTNKIVRPLKITDARRHDPVNVIDTPLTIISRFEYQWQPEKLSTGEINQFYYDPQLGTGKLFLWQVITAVGDLVKFTWHKPIEDFDSAGDNPDLPQEWIDTLIFNLAVVMAPEFEVPRNVMEGEYGVGAQADKYLDQLTGYDREHEGVSFGMDFDR